ncbi:hypothetical protein ABXS75_02975 [Roseburia hominis]
MSEQYEVVWPSGKCRIEPVPMAPRIKDLNEAVILELNHNSYRGDEIFPVLREELKRRYPGIRFITYDVLGNFRDARNYGGYELESWPGLSDFIRENKVTGAVAGVGG